MATYKVLQDIEAEDKLIGPLTLRQCIYAAIAIAAGWLAFLFISKHRAFLAVPLLPFIGFGVFFAFPWKAEQSTEVWALAKIRFMLKPRRRIWDQSGIKQLVDITAPKAVEDPRRAKNLSENEVRSRLRALADTIDSRGWAVKNAPIDLYTQPAVFQESDRLIQPSAFPREVPTLDADSSDMFDLQNNPLARQVQEKMNAAAAAQRQQAVNMLNNPQSAQPHAPNYWYGAGPAAGAGSSVPSDDGVPPAILPAAADGAANVTQSQPQPTYAHMRVIQPLSSAQPSQTQAGPQPAQAAVGTAPVPVPASVQNASAPVTPPVNPAILGLANNNDLNVATIAREANHINPDSDEGVVVSLR